MRETYITILGNVVDQPRVVVTANGTVLTKFRLSSAPSNRREDGSWERGYTSFYDVTCFKKLGENVAASLAPGDGIFVLGKLEVREWTKDDRHFKDVQITANCVGHDLLFGITTLRRPGKAVESSAADGDEFREIESGEAGEDTEAA